MSSLGPNVHFGSRSPIQRRVSIMSISDVSWVPNFMKTGAHFNVWTRFARIYNFGLRSSTPSIFIFSMFDLLWVPNFIKIEHTAILRPNLPKYLILSQDPKLKLKTYLNWRSEIKIKNIIKIKDPKLKLKIKI